MRVGNLISIIIFLSFGIGSSFHAGSISVSNTLQIAHPARRIDIRGYVTAYGTAPSVSDAVEGSSSFEIIPSIGDESSINDAAKFMVDAFWLQSPQQLVKSDDTNPVVSDGVQQSLASVQAEDLTDKYGERMGKRLMESCLLTAKGSDDEILGLIGIEVCLLNKELQQIMTPEKSEDMLKQTVAALGPKQRRQYKNSSTSDLATELLPAEFMLVCCLSNLSVSPKARRKGVAMKLCNKAEEVAKKEFGFKSLYLKVEAENLAARGLYEGKLGYVKQFSDAAGVGLRVDTETGAFVEEEAETLVLEKTL